VDVPLPDTLTTRVVATTSELEALKSKWTTLHAAANTTAFQSYEWNRAWWRHFGEPDPRLRLHVLVLEQGGQTLAIAPLVIETVRVLGVLPLRQVGMLGRVVSDYADVLVMPGCEQVVFPAIAQHIVSGTRCDALSFLDIPNHSPTRETLGGLFAALGWSTGVQMRDQCPRTQLLDSWPATLATFAASHRKRLEYLDRKLKKNFTVEFRRVRPQDDVEPAMQEFFEMHQRRWSGTAEAGAFANPAAARFHLEVAREFNSRGWLVLVFLVLNGRPVAVNYAFKMGGTLQFYLSGVGDYAEARRFAPGILLHVHCMQAMIEEGVAVYDFLRGTERYKYELGAQDVPNWGLSFVRDSSAARMKHRAHVLRQRLGAKVKRAYAVRRVRPTPPAGAEA
jgi:CelD/BcsL family acetyltransferase involved in cellulose biosynthesis